MNGYIVDCSAGQLEMDTTFVDLVGLSTMRDHPHIFGASNGLGTGVLRQTANPTVLYCVQAGVAYP